MTKRLSMKQARRMAGMTTVDTAVALGLSRSAYYRRESYLTPITYKEACDFAELVGLDKDDIVFFKDDVPSEGDA